MRRRIGGLLAFLIVVAAVVSPPRAALAARWVSGNEKFFSITRLCRDGMEASAIVSVELDPAEVRSIGLAARLWSNRWLPDITTFPFPAPLIQEYGPALQPNTNLLLPYHDTPLAADIDEDGTPEEFNHYGSATYTWSRLLNVGDVVILHENTAAYTSLPVENCLLNQLEVNEGAQMTIDGAKLKVNDGLIADADLVYRLDALPAHGQLRLSGTPLAVGATWSQSDVNAGRLTFVHDGSETTADSFQFTVQGTSRVSVRGATEANGDSQNAVISYDARAIAFESTASNLVGGDTNNASDVFWRDQQAKETLRRSVAASGAQGNGGSFRPVLDKTGFFMAFESDASNLVNDETDPPGGTPDCSKQADTNGRRDIFLTHSGELTFNFPARQSISTGGFGCLEADSNSQGASIASDGQFVVFSSDATNLLKNNLNIDDTNAVRDVYGTAGGDMLRFSIRSGSPYDYANAREAHGGGSVAPALAGVDTGLTTPLLAYASDATDLLGAGVDTNAKTDVFVRRANDTIRVSVSTAGVQGNDFSDTPAISHSGRFVAFRSLASNLVSGDTNAQRDIFVRDRDTDNDGAFDEAGFVATSRISLSTDGTQGDNGSYDPWIAAGGRYVAFESDATNLVSGDTNGQRDIFVRDRDTDNDGVFDEPGAVRTTRVSVSGAGAQGNSTSSNPVISADGSFVAFDSDASSLVAGDTNSRTDVFLHYQGFSSSFSIEVNPIDDVLQFGYLPLLQR